MQLKQKAKKLSQPGTLWSNILPLEEGKREPYAEVNFLCFKWDEAQSTKRLLVCSLTNNQSLNEDDIKII